MTNPNRTLSYLARFPCHPIIQPPTKKKEGRNMQLTECVCVPSNLGAQQHYALIATLYLWPAQLLKLTNAMAIPKNKHTRRAQPVPFAWSACNVNGIVVVVVDALASAPSSVSASLFGVDVDVLFNISRCIFVFLSLCCVRWMAAFRGPYGRRERDSG